MSNVIELKDPASLECLLSDIDVELHKQGESPECIGYVSWAIAAIHTNCKLDEAIPVQPDGIGGAKALKHKIDALVAELISAHVWIWHCGGSVEYGFPGPERKKPAQSAKGAGVFTLYKREPEGEQ